MLLLLSSKSCLSPLCHQPLPSAADYRPDWPTIQANDFIGHQKVGVDGGAPKWLLQSAGSFELQPHLLDPDMRIPQSVLAVQSTVSEMCVGQGEGTVTYD